MNVLERYGEYQLVRYLTAGGMADLYLAEHPNQQGYVVVKKIQPRYVEMTRVVKMFIDEGRIAQALDHPNVVKIVDVGHEGGTWFIAMEYIPGRDLLAIARRGVEVGSFVPRHLGVAILTQALRGLIYAHEKIDDEGKPLKVVHCDISPGNIVLSWGGTAKIVDFGIARATIQLRAEDHSVAGKYNYMAPEQIRGEPIDARADVFALGVILYEITVGKRLFKGRPEQVMMKVLEEPIEKPSAVREDYPRFLEAIVMQALERDPARRYQTARHLRDDLRAFLRETGLPHGKRELALYLRDIFAMAKTHDADDSEFGVEEDEDDELVLERGVPQLPGDEMEVPFDADDPEDEVSPHLPLALDDTDPRALSPEARAADDARPPSLETTRPRPRIADESSTASVPAHHPSPRRPWLPIAAGAIAAVALALYFLLGR